MMKPVSVTIVGELGDVVVCVAGLRGGWNGGSMALSTDGPSCGVHGPEPTRGVCVRHGATVMWFRNFGFHNRTKEISARCGKLSMRAADGADFISVFYLVL